VKIALVKLSSVGDVVHALPVAATLAARRPDVSLTWIVERREAAILRGHPALDAVVTADTRGWRHAAGLGAAPHAILALRRRLAAARFDAVLDLQGLLKSAILAWLTRAPLRIGFAASALREPLSALLTNRHVTPPAQATHVVEQYLALLEPLGVREPVLEFRLPSDPLAEAAVGEFFSANGLKPCERVVALSPGAGRAIKRWPATRFAALAARLAGEHAAAVIVAWGPGEEALARDVVRAADTPRVLMAPPTDLLGLLALLRRASVVVAGDTGPLHLAAAADTPCVALWRPRPGDRNDAQRNGPYGRGHRIVQSADGRMESIAVEPVLRAVTAVLG
jgi:lipopolysaccharide heptosyltransferase I